MGDARALTVLKEGIAAAKAGDKVRARQLLQEAADLDPRSEPAQLWLAGVAESPLEALSHLEAVLAFNPTHERALVAVKTVRLQAGIAAAKARDRDLARTILERAVEHDPASELGWMWLASVAESPETAATCLKKVLALNPANEKARIGLERYRAAQAQSSQPASPPQARNESAPAPYVATTVGPPPEEPTVAVRTRLDAQRLSAQTVLVVDDSPTIRKLVTLTVERRGYRVRTASDGFEAVNLIRDHGVPDLILLDINMPGMDGYQLCRMLRQNADTTNVPIVLLSGKDGFFSKMRGRMAGSDQYLTKPFEPEALLRVVERYCPADDNSPLTAGAAD
jgi:twitching motility two-component system response regulator PilG